MKKQTLFELKEQVKLLEAERLSLSLKLRASNKERKNLRKALKAANLRNLAFIGDNSDTFILRRD